MSGIPSFVPGAVVTAAQLDALAALAANNGQTISTVTASGNSYASAPTSDSNFTFVTQAIQNQAGVAFSPNITGYPKAYINLTTSDVLIWPASTVAINGAPTGEALRFSPGRTIVIYQASAVAAYGIVS